MTCGGLTKPEVDDAAPLVTRYRAVFLDRDGVLNRPLLRDGRPHPPATLEEFEIYPEAGAALHSLRRAGFKLVVVTNQPDVARGTQTLEQVEAMHALLRRALPVDEIRVCYHDDGMCLCRKPLPGLLTMDSAADLPRSFMIGDRWRDVEAGQSAGCTTIFIDRGYSERRPDNPDVTVKSVAEAAIWIARHISS